MRLLALIFLLANLATMTWVRNFSPHAIDQAPFGRFSEVDLGVGLELVINRDVVDATEAITGPDVPPQDMQTEAVAGYETEAERLLEPITQVAENTSPVNVVATIDQQVRECVELGPFSNEDLASVAAVRLRDIGYSPTLRESGGQIRSGFWVYLPPYSNRQDAERAVADLRQKGTTDLFVVTGSQQLNAVSLGLFNNSDHADQRAAVIGRLGYTPRIAERFRDATVFWIEYRENPDNPLTPEDVGVFANALELPEQHVIVCGSG